MSRLLLVRHGQASLGADDYDRLSSLGERQGRAIGTYLGALGRRFDRVVVGPRLRHRQTFEATAEAAREAGAPLPEPAFEGTFDEHQCPEVLAHHRPRLAETLGLDADAKDTRTYLRLFRNGSLLWVRGELETPEPLENWPTFRARIDQNLEDLRRQNTDKKSQIVVFTSGGAIAAAAGTALGLPDPAVMELSWGIRNGSLTELRLTPEGIHLFSFNTVPFHDPELLTYV